MTTPSLPRDGGLAPIQALQLNTNASLSTSAVSARVALPSATKVIRIASTATGYLKFGDSSVTATSSDVVFPAGVEVFSLVGTSHTHVAFINDSGSGVVSATRMV